LIYLSIMVVLGLIIIAALALGRRIEPFGLEKEIAPGVKPHVPSEEVGIFGARQVKVEEILAQGSTGFPLEEETVNPEVEKALEEGAELMEEGETDQAVDTLLMALVDEPENPDLLLALGDAYRELELYGQALDTYEKAGDILPGDVTVLMRLAETFEILDEKVQAMEIYQEIMHINSEIAEASDSVERLENELAESSY